MKYCIVKRCNGKCVRTGSRFSHLGFPRDSEKQKRWLELCGREDVKLSSLKYHSVCSKHFAPSSFERNLMHELLGGKNHRPQIKLKPDAEPTLHLPSKTETSIVADEIREKNFHDRCSDEQSMYPSTVQDENVSPAMQKNGQEFVQSVSRGLPVMDLQDATSISQQSCSQQPNDEKDASNEASKEKDDSAEVAASSSKQGSTNEYDKKSKGKSSKLYAIQGLVANHQDPDSAIVGHVEASESQIDLTDLVSQSVGQTDKIVNANKFSKESTSCAGSSFSTQPLKEKEEIKIEIKEEPTDFPDFCEDRDIERDTMIKNNDEDESGESLQTDEPTQETTSEEHMDESSCDAFGKFIATQLRELPLENALNLQMEIHNIIAQERVKVLQEKKKKTKTRNTKSKESIDENAINMNIPSPIIAETESENKSSYQGKTTLVEDAEKQNISKKLSSVKKTHSVKRPKKECSQGIKQKRLRRNESSTNRGQSLIPTNSVAKLPQAIGTSMDNLPRRETEANYRFSKAKTKTASWRNIKPEGNTPAQHNLSDITANQEDPDDGIEYVDISSPGSVKSELESISSM